MEQQEILTTRERLRQRRMAHRAALWQEVERLTATASALGVQRIILFGSLARGEPGLTVIWICLSSGIRRSAFWRARSSYIVAFSPGYLRTCWSTHRMRWRGWRILHSHTLSQQPTR